MVRNVSDVGSTAVRPASGHAWVRELRAETEDAVSPVCRPETIAALVDQVGEGAAQWAIELGRLIAERTIRQFPEFGGWKDAESTLRLGTEQVAIAMLRSIDAGRLVHTANSAETRAMIHDYVQRRVPMDRIWHGMRSGHAWLNEEFMAACKRLADRGHSPEELEYVSQSTFQVVITFAAETGDLYRVEDEAWVSGAEYARDEVIRAILSEDPGDEDSASHVLRYSLAQHHVSCVVTVGEAAETPADPCRHASEVLRAIGVNTTLIVRRSGTEVHAWGGSDRRVSVSEADAIAMKTSVDGVQVAIGLGERGAAGFRRSYYEANRAASIAASLGRPPRSVVTYNQVSLLGLLLENPAEAVTFAERELGPLAARTKQMETLRETVATYFECRHSPRSAGEKLFIAKNTVLYRLKKAEELLDRSLDERPAETWAALLVAQAVCCPPPDGYKEVR